MEKESELSLALTQFYKLIYVDFGIKTITGKLKNWYQLSWEEFKQELNRFKAKYNDSILQDWEPFFNSQKVKVQSLMQ